MKHIVSNDGYSLSLAAVMILRC